MPELNANFPPFLLVGATASGKSSLASKIAERYGYEIWSTDSRQSYKFLDIGTAAPTKEELSKIVHHNIGVLLPSEKESASFFMQRLAQIRPDWKRTSNKKKPLLFVGGSTLNAQTLLLGLDDMPSANEQNIEQLNKQFEQEGGASLLAKLNEVDPVYAASMEGFNKQRCFRALDVWMQTGKAFSSFHTKNAKEDLTPSLPVVGIRWDREKLYTRINERVDQMWENGLIEEYQQVISQGYDENAHALQGVGYDEVARYLRNEISLDMAKEVMKTKTRRYAKRQITWFKRWPFIHWIDAENKAFMNLCNWVEALPNKR